jgi:hypothetical protein
MDELPAELLSKVFEYLNAGDALSSRRVCSKWKNRLTGCGHITVNIDYLRTRRILPVWVGRSWLGKVKSGLCLHGQVVKNGTQESGELAGEAQLHVHPIGSFGAALCFERMEEGYFWRSLDFDQSTFDLSYLVGGSYNPGHKYIKHVLKTADLSGLTKLEHLNVSGCSKLETLLLPPNLKSLDASDCPVLRNISFPAGRCELNHLNVNYCHSLVAFKANAFNDTTTQLGRILRMSTHLTYVSLRSVATDELLCSLSESVSARANLRRIDASQSGAVCDTSVEVLTKATLNLEEMIIDGCKSISKALHERCGSRRKRSCDDMIEGGYIQPETGMALF